MITVNKDHVQADLADWAANDYAGYSKFEADLQKGDGNAMCYDLANAVTSGKLTKQEAADIGSTVQKTANEKGGGKINNDAKLALADSLDGQQVIHGGKTRPQMKAEKAFAIIGMVLMCVAPFLL